ncbi:RecQ family ATP-dependent DNA helicase [Lacihabitans sp. CCS-44]|uniref:RecQ family ATP-dependent DNA helicase n=1 Tax=Lacihabitans sp. CCS-44 TaxID=2487331 RepID=UPI0020CF098E|nr:ATP-dependent DNA helicase RecQ [Lacihabitans sp. CCS-44]MCP9756889.1 RecQ family ATP-dependent DNA helicase [Lacihabitans sp. CCS-44]
MLLPEEILKKYWGYSDFRPLQKEIINSVLAKNDTMALLPTGGGKSICFQVPGLILEGICIVVSPLIALMKDQVRQLKERNISSEAIYSGMKFSEIEAILDDAVDGKIKFLYVSPERLKARNFQDRIKYMQVGLFAIDEAHCISKWGYDFRPAYLQISDFKKLIPNVNTIALTATATEKVRKDIIDKLDLKKSNTFVQSFARNNLSYSVIETDQKENKLLQILIKVEGTAIVYTKTRNRTVEFSKFLKANGISADYYHAGLSLKERNKKQEDWINNITRVMVSTNAFGMGIDKPDVRCVVHVDLCENLEAYYQESGRAGRDNYKAYAVSLYNITDIENLETNLELKYPDPQFLSKVYQSLCNYYKLAFESEAFESFDFEIQNFTATFGMNVRLTHYALKLLESQGLIYLSDAYFNPSKLKIIANPIDFYNFQLRNPSLELFCKTLLRIYGGEIYANYISISEQEIGNSYNASFNEVLQNLNLLNKHHIVDYSPQKSVPQLGFLTPRQDAENLSINHKEIEQRKINEKKALRSVKLYTEQTAKCRMLLIQDYFDENTSKTCGICDVCLKMKRLGLATEQTNEITKRILNILPSTPSNLENKMIGEDKLLITKILKYHFESGTLAIDGQGLIYKR